MWTFIYRPHNLPGMVLWNTRCTPDRYDTTITAGFGTFQPRPCMWRTTGIRNTPFFGYSIFNSFSNFFVWMFFRQTDYG